MIPKTKNHFPFKLIEERDSKIHCCWVSKLVNTKLKLNYYGNLGTTKVVNYSVKN